MLQRFNNKVLGFSLLEIILALLILAILAAVIAPRYRATGTDDWAAANTLKSHLRYVQLRAMGDVCPWRIDFSNTREYQLVRQQMNTTGTCDDDDTGTANFPGTGNRVTLTRTVSELTVSPPPSTTIYFSPGRGQPLDHEQNLLNDIYTITLGTHRIEIHPETGFM